MEVVVFDLDGTLLSTDSTKAWLIKQLQSNPFRFIGAAAVTPIAIPMMKIKKYKSMGASLFLWIATYRLSKYQLEESFKAFATELKNTSFPKLYWFEDGIVELRSHLKENRQIIITTAAPELLALELLKSIDFNIKVIGTPLRRKMGGWVGGIHCRHEEKLRRLQLIGINQKWLATYSDDIEEDYPILENSKYPYLINGGKQKKLSKKLKNIQYLEWS